MTNFILSKCEVLSILKRRYGVTPATIEPWFNSTLFDLSYSVQSLRTWVWRFDRKRELNAPITGGIEFPFFVGSLSLYYYNDIIFTNSPGYWVNAEIRTITSIEDIGGGLGTFFLMEAEQMKVYADGATFNGPLIPGERENEEILEKLIVAPFMTVKVNVDLTGGFNLFLVARFSGYMIYL